ncbi:amino acid adenylation domain-containing protein [Saccharothrix ecbatanensis]|uniref:Amino acid adenylation domain-containing protein n=1 Tax=Saccharothrix ecbatanensis TaxID=1105145 RepID=A0A7W9HJ53_9PSEU|nr:non-ribosomal peptide synthetase [Saccharothrix ecbatanensis]MBB5803253.1 amino acid adenylation domain-containing protein [Saccharothrix ecbatanensis]
MVLLLPQLILERAREHPDAPAVLSAEGDLTYGALVERAGRIAGALRSLGVGAESVVGVLVRPGPELVAILLGTWLAGGCYLPLDPLHPARRLRRAVALAGARTVVADRPLSDVDLPPDVTVRRPDQLDHPDADAVDPYAVRTGSRDAAYMIFTSGSTGEPKGAVVEHAGIANVVRWSVHRLGLSPADRLLQKTPLTFDAAQWEVFAPLACGAAVTVAGTEAGRDPAALVQAVLDRRATVLQVVPSMLRLLAADPEFGRCDSLRMICAGGEELRAELCQRVLSRLDVEIWNLYGPAECSIDVAAGRFDPAQHTGTVPIGRPVDDVRCLLLTPDGRPAATGEVAELHVCGVGVGRGYRGDPALTAQRFLPDVTGPAGARMYRTGDLARERPDGSLEFVGRADAQVKVNGIRIEPGEVEAAVLTHPGVVDAAVRAVVDQSGAARLAAYVVTTPDGSVDDLAAHVRDHLPPSLVPTVVTEVAALPRTSSGKIDRARLPEPDWTLAPAGPRPLTPLQRIVRDAWRQVLGVADGIGPDDDFFRVGGHSLMMTRLAPRLVEASGLDLDVADLYRAMTVRAQADVLARAMAARPVPRLPDGARLPLSPAQERFWLLDRMRPGSPEYLLPVVVRLPAGIPADTVRQALTRLAERHDVLRSRYLMDADGLHAVVDVAPTVALRVASTADRVADVLAAEFATGFDLRHGPLWRSVLLPGAGDAKLLLVLHHVIGDGWSAGLLDRETRELVAASAEGRAPRLPELPLRYVDVVAWQRARTGPQQQADDVEYWRRELAGLPVLDLTGGRARDPRRRTDGAAVALDIPAETAGPLLELGREAGATPFMTFLAVWSLVLAHSSGQWDFGVATPHAGRTRPESHDLVGPFVNTVVIRPRLTPELTFSDALRHVQRTCRAAFAHHATPFEAVVEAVRPQPDPARTPLFQVLFAFVDGLLGERPHDDDVDLVRDAWSVARTDLTLTMWRHDDGRFGCALEYATALYDRAAVDALLRRLRQAAAWCAARPDVPLGDLDLDLDGVADDRPPMSPHRRTILGLFRELLQRQDIGVDQSFFDEGGTSLHAARLLWSVENAFGVEVPMRAIFDQPTAAGLAAVVEELVRAEIDDMRVPSSGPREENTR